MYKEPPGEVGQLKLMIKRIEEKREDLRQKRRDLEETLAELDQAEESASSGWLSSASTPERPF